MMMMMMMMLLLLFQVIAVRYQASMYFKISEFSGMLS